MVSSETPPLSIRHRTRIAPDPDVKVEKVFLAVGQQIGFDKLAYASRMNKAVVVFLKEIDAVSQRVESGVVIRDSLRFVSLLALPSSRVTVWSQVYRRLSLTWPSNRSYGGSGGSGSLHSER
ncbi:hypothetical protein NHX12_027500 [Muraenolepis orangiensis]|uniref:Uncharacterized protein n=1 Tax=Muraenolepis orangiensis TaxID=630683 RepID=A0A9Q0INW4_9TELE|nr:hypothetical protein NHX12_027500 [Muraenolepis orangiensis]